MPKTQAEFAAASLAATPALTEESRAGPWLVLGSAIVWSFGGTFGRLTGIGDPWVVVTWRAGFAALFILGFMLWRDGRKGMWDMIASMGLPGAAVALCFASASSSFIVALNYTTVANILLLQAGVPLIAALISFVLFREAIRIQTWLAIAAVIAGVAVMVSHSLAGGASALGDGLALYIALAFASATVITRRNAQIRMTPAVFFGALVACLFAASTGLASGSDFSVGPTQFLVLGAFGISLGLGMAMFTTGARLIPSAFAALLGTAETVLGPIWVWLFLGEVPALRTLVGGGMVLAALLAYLVWQLGEQKREQRNRPVPAAF